MIAKMQHITLLTLESSLEKTLQHLRNLGVMHVQQKSVPNHASVASLNERENKIFSLITSYPSHAEKAKNIHREELLTLVETLYEKATKLKEDESRLETLNAELNRLAPLGDFNMEDLIELRTKNVFLQLFLVPPKAVPPLWEDVYLFPLGKVQKNDLIAVVADRPLETDKLPLFELPEHSPSKIREEIRQIEASLIEGNKELNASLHTYKGDLEEFLQETKQDLEFEKVRLSTESLSDTSVVALEGYVQTKSAPQIEKEAENNGWGYELREVTDEDEGVPTKIENNWLVRLIQPLFSFLDTYPGYKEIDLNPFVLPFFILFYAMLIGDAGYGAILSLSLLLFRKKIPPLAFSLLLVLSLATVGWGMLSGTYFGSLELLMAMPVLQSLIWEPIASFGDNLYNGFDSFKIWRYCFIIGTTQICLGYLIAFIRNIRKPSALSDLAWLCFVLGAYRVVLVLVLGEQGLPQYSIVLIIIGYIGVLLFSQQEKGRNPVVGVLMGMAWFPITFLDSISNFANIISYIRLYAVGLASVSIASSFNGMALPFFENPGTAIFGVLILLVAHTLNLVMALLAVIVHGVRLNLLEFAGSAGMEWTGVSYNPFKKA